jgi:hypothetical protein
VAVDTDHDLPDRPALRAVADFIAVRLSADEMQETCR